MPPIFCGIRFDDYDSLCKLRKGNTWTLIPKLEDLEFANDLVILSHRLQDMQDKITALLDTSIQVGPKINKEKQK